MTTDFTHRRNRTGVSPRTHPFPSRTEPLLWSLKETAVSPTTAVVFEGQTTTTAEGRQEYTVSMRNLSADERMTHWLTVDAEAVVSLENSR